MRLWSLAFLLVVVTGCAQLPPEPNTGGEVAALLPKSMSWRASGKMLVTSSSNNQTLRFSWTHSANIADRVVVSDSLGLRSAVLLHNKNGFFTVDSDNRLTPLSDAMATRHLALLKMAPPENWAALLTGIQLDSNTVVAQVLDWSVLDAYRVPRRLRIEANDDSLRIIINEWEVIDGE
jgi:outer membrane biogenesis lipoprotein LolB